MLADHTLPVLDALIVGGGPAGLNAALVLARACRRVVVVDDGQPRNKAARKMHGFIGRDGTDPRRLTTDARAEVSQYGVELVDDTVVDVTHVEQPHKHGIPSGFAVTTKSGRAYVARKILFATGMCDELPQLPGVEACYGISVHHCPYCDGWEHRGQHLLSYGSDIEAAIGLALSLRGWSNQVTVLTNGIAPEPEDRKRLTANGVSWREETVLELVHNQGVMSGVKFTSGEFLPAAALFFNTEQWARCDLPKKLGCVSDECGRAETSEKKRTAHPGVFVAGDADGDVQLVIVAAAEGATAAMAMNRELQEEDRS